MGQEKNFAKYHKWLKITLDKCRYILYNKSITKKQVTKEKQMAQLETLATVIVYGSVIVSIGGLLANIICWNILGK